MCGMALGVVGGVISAIGTYASGMASSAMSKYNAKVAKINARAAIREGMAQSYATRDQFAEEAGKQRAALAKSGVDINSGTAALLQTETMRREEHAAATDIWRGRTEQVRYLNEEKLLKAEAKAQKQGAMIGALSGLAGALGNVKIGGSAGGGNPVSL